MAMTNYVMGEVQKGFRPSVMGTRGRRIIKRIPRAASQIEGYGFDAIL